MYDKDIEIISNGDSCDGILFVISGKIDIEVEGEEGEDKVVATLKRGDIIGCKSVLEGLEYDFNALSTSKSVSVFKLSKEFLDANVKKVQGLNDLLLEGLNYYQNSPDNNYDFIIDQKNNKKMNRR